MPLETFDRSSRTMRRIFGMIARRRLRSAFRAVRIAGSERVRGAAAQDGPLALYMNHPSWWDPLVCIAVSDALLPGRAYFGAMDAAALARYGIFRGVGAFPVEMGTPRGAAQFLRAGAEVLRQNGVLWVTPQGSMRDVRERPVHLMAGLGALLARSGSVTVLPLAVEYTFWNQRSPELLLLVGGPVTCAGNTKSDAWTAALERGLEDAQDRLHALSTSRDASRFELLLEGAAGASGVYGWWQRLRGGAQDHVAPLPGSRADGDDA